MSFKVSWLYKAKDQFSPAIKSIQKAAKKADEQIKKTNTSIKKMPAALSKMKRGLDSAGSSMRKFGKSMSLKMTAPIAAFGVLAMKSFDSQAKALAKVENGLKSTGGTAKLSFDQLKNAASDLQSNTLFGDEEILNNATAQLLTFTNIAGDNFLKTQEVALDLATKLDGDLKSASIMLGKALNDPVANLSALSRAGIQFSTEQKDVVKKLVETNRLSDAQTIILAELEKQYGGTAKAAALAGTGGWTQLKNIMGDLMEDIGSLINDVLKPLVPMLKSATVAVRGFLANNPQLAKLAIILGIVAAVIPPLVLGIGSLVFVFGLLSAPLIAAIALATLFTTAAIMVASNFDAMVDGAKFMAQDIASWFGSVVDTVVGTVKIIGEQIDAIINKITGFYSNSSVGKFFNNAGSSLGDMIFDAQAKLTGGGSESSLMVEINDKGGNVKSTKQSSSGRMKTNLNRGTNAGLN